MSRYARACKVLIKKTKMVSVGDAILTLLSEECFNFVEDATIELCN